jgi:hypothetical protein
VKGHLAQVAYLEVVEVVVVEVVVRQGGLLVTEPMVAVLEEKKERAGLLELFGVMVVHFRQLIQEMYNEIIYTITGWATL